MTTKKFPSTEEVEHSHESKPRQDRLEGSKESESPKPEFYPIGNPQDPGREVKPEPWDNQEFYAKVRAAGFPTSSYGDAAFMQACYNLATAVQPPPPDPPEKKHAEKVH
jgi:hypothetical protein